MKTFLFHLLEKLKASAWTIPAALSIAAILLSQLSLDLDHHYYSPSDGLLSWIEVSSAEGARSVLSTIATSLLTVAGVSFSSIMVTMTLASQQFGPRLLRNFIKDKFSQIVLGALIATYVYCLFILRGVRTASESPFVPQFSTLTALVLTMICLGLFIRFVHHIITEIQVERVAADAYGLLENSIKAVFPERGAAMAEQWPIEPGERGWDITAGKTGYVQAINYETLAEIAQANNATFSVLPKAGDFISQGRSVVRVVDGPLEKEATDSFRSDIRGAFLSGQVRTSEQDFEYGIRQLVELALRALSPGINDPFTAMNCIDYLGAGLQLAFSRPLPHPVRRDEEGNVRLFCRKSSYRDLVETSINQIRQAAVERCDVSCRLLEMLAETAELSNSAEQQDALMEQGLLIKENTLPALTNDHDRESLLDRFDHLTQTCHLIDPTQNA